MENRKKPDGRGKSEGSKRTQQKAGEKGKNQDGRPPKGFAISDMMKERMGDWVVDNVNGKNVRMRRNEKIARRITDLAETGSEKHLRILLDYTEGKPVQKVEISGEGAERLNLLDDAEKDV